ncbi:MAG: AAA family ATPase [Cyanobacteria bacterium J06621_8]
MHISKIRVQNYKAFYDSGWIEFKPGINIISGQNHSGKTALLEAISTDFLDFPHKSLKTLPTLLSSITAYSKVDIGIVISFDELLNYLSQDKQSDGSYILTLPRPAPTASLDSIMLELNKKLSSVEGIKLDLNLCSDGIDILDIQKNLHLFTALSINSYAPGYQGKSREVFDVIQARIDGTTAKIYDKKSSTSLFKNIFATEFSIVKILPSVQSKIYRFYAQRKIIGKYQFSNNLELIPDASNLAQVIHCLQSRFPNKFNQFNNLISIVLPHITGISTRLIINDEQNEVELRIWSIDPATDRDDLAFPLEACGTGVGQVLAILYVVLISQEPRTIIIDEPQSYLHPGAARKLIEILQDFPQHQYFISTHSPSIIAAANPSSMTLLKYQDSEATALSISADDTEEMRSLLDDVGVHLSDVFGLDNILWVEGPTEERCFPLILKQIAKVPLQGTQVLAVKNTGDFESKNKVKSKIYFDIYDRLSGGEALLPPAIGFILDNENRAEQNIEDLKKRSKGKLYFLDRCMYENYLLVPEAITAVCNHSNLRAEPISVSEVEQWIAKNKQQWTDQKISKGAKKEDLTDDYWLKTVHAANLLSALFKDFFGSDNNYKKTTHSVELTEWIVENKPEELQEIADLLRQIILRSRESSS